MQLDLTQDDILSLERRTEGWIAGLQLAASFIAWFDRIKVALSRHLPAATAIFWIT